MKMSSSKLDASDSGGRSYKFECGEKKNQSYRLTT